MPEYNDPQSNKVTSDTKPLKKGKTEVVKDVISKGKTMTGQKPDEIILNPVLEAKEKRAVFAFGRFNPPTIGHEKLIHKVEDTAKSQGAEAHIIASHTEGNAKNPIPKEKKVEYLKRIAAEGTNVTGSSSEHPTLLHHLANLHKAGVQHITMVAGDDRVEEYYDLIHKYNGVEGRHGTFNFKSINVVSAGARDPDAEGAEGMSGTKMREHARSGNTKEFKKGLPKALHPHAKEIMDQIKSIKEEVDDLFDNFIIETAIDKIGQIYDQVIQESYDEDKENAKIKSVSRSNTHDRDDGKSERTLLYKNDTPGEPKSSKVKEDINNTFEAWVDDENPEPKYREVVNRHGQDRKKIVLVPRGDADRKDCDRPYRQQEIQKKIVDEGKKMSPWDKMVKAMPKLRDSEERAQAAKAGLQQAGKDYQAILDREAEAKKKTNESVNSIGGVRGMGHVSGSPDGDGSGYVGNNIADADTRDNIIKAHINAHFAMHMVNQKVTKEEKLNEDLRKWFKDKWVRMDTKGNIKGDCAREPGEGKPKCLPLAKAQSMEKEKRAAAAQRKRREDPVADRPGKGGAPINVKTEQFEYIEEKNKPTNPSLWARAKSLAKSKFDVYPSAYANGWAAKWYKSKGGGWKSTNEEFINEENWYTTEPQQDGTHKVTKINNQKNPYNHKVGDIISKGEHTVRQYTSDGSAYGSEVKKEQYEVIDEMGKKGTFRPVSPGVQNVRTAQAATRGDKALDKQYHYGTTKGGVSPIAGKRREQGFGAVANYNSAQAALTAKKQGANPKGQDAAIHKGWGKTVDQMPAANPEKQAARKKLQQTSFSSLSKGEQEKDTVLRKGITSEETKSLDEKTSRDHVQISSEMQRQKRRVYYRKRRLAGRHLTKHSKNIAQGIYRNTALGHHDRGRFVTIRVNEDSNVIKQLEDKLNVATDKSYDGIDQIMRQVANENNIDVHDLHDMWVKETGITPDQYVKEARIYFGKNRERYTAQRKPLSPEAEKIMKDAETKISQSAVPSKQAIKDRQTKTRADYEKEIPSDYKPKLHKD